MDMKTDSAGVAKHWHITSGKCLHKIEAEGDNQLNAVDYRTDGSMFATAGSDKTVRTAISRSNSRVTREGSEGYPWMCAVLN